MTESRVDTSESECRLEPLSELSDCKLAEGTPDIRGWDVTSPTSVHLGVVQDLLVDLASLRVRYLDVTLDSHPSEIRRVLLPIGKVWINEALDEVVVPASLSLETLPAYDPARFDRAFEYAVLAAFGDAVGTDFHAGSAFDVISARNARVDHVVCARRSTDLANAPCPRDDETEAANGIELTVVTETGD